MRSVIGLEVRVRVFEMVGRGAARLPEEHQLSCDLCSPKASWGSGDRSAVHVGARRISACVCSAFLTSVFSNMQNGGFGCHERLLSALVFGGNYFTLNNGQAQGRFWNDGNSHLPTLLESSAQALLVLLQGLF